MDQTFPEFKRGVLRPLVCLSAGWQLIKDQYWVFWGMSFVGIVLGSMAPMGLLLGPMMCGLHLAFFRHSSGEAVRFEDLTKGFEYFMQSLIATLIQVIPMVVIVTPVYVISIFGFLGLMARAANTSNHGSPASLLPGLLIFAVMLVLIFALSLIVGTFFMFTYPLIVDKKLSGVDAVKLSIKAAQANIVSVFGLNVLLFALGIGGSLLCYVGAFLLLPVSMAARHVAYKQVFGEV